MFQQKSIANKTLVILLATSLFVLLVFSFLGARQSDEQEAMQANLQLEIADLEGSLIELNDMGERSERGKLKAESEVAEKKEQMAKMAAKIGGLEEKVAQMEKEGSADKALIKKLQEKLAEAKNTLVKNYQKQVDLLYEDNVSLSQKKDNLEYELMVKDSLCRLEDKALGLQAWLKAENIQFTALKNDKAEKGNSFKRNKVETLKVSFDLIGTGPVPNNTKQIYLIVESANKQTLQDAQNRTSWFNFKGKQVPYSNMTKAEYAGTPIRLDMFFDPKDNKMPKGTYQIKIFTEVDFIGQREVVIL